MGKITTQREPLNYILQSELEPLLTDHKDEVAHYKDIPLDVDWDKYYKLQELNVFVMVTIRDDKRLIGYAVYFVGPNPHYQESIQALQDILFLHPDYRNCGNGYHLIEASEMELRKLKVQVVQQHVKRKKELDFSRLLHRMGYEDSDLILVKRLD